MHFHSLRNTLKWSENLTLGLCSLKPPAYYYLNRLLLLKPSASLSSSFRMNYVTPRKTFGKSRQNVKSCCFFFCSGPPLLSTLPKSHNSLSIKRWIAALVSQKPSCSRDASPFGKEIRGGHRSDPHVEFPTFYLRLHPSLFRKLTNLLDFFTTGIFTLSAQALTCSF